MSRSYFLPLLISSLIKTAAKVAYFPLWWYTKGFAAFVRGTLAWLQGQSRSIGAGVWLRNIFVPMYGQRDFAGRVISFFIRLVQIIVRGLASVVLAALSLLAIALWFALPLAVLAAIYWQLYG